MIKVLLQTMSYELMMLKSGKVSCLCGTTPFATILASICDRNVPGQVAAHTVNCGQLHD